MARHMFKQPLNTTLITGSHSINAPLTMGLILFVATFAAHSPAIHADFIWDDDTFLTNNPIIKASDGLYRFWFTTDPYDYFPLTSSMLWIEWRLWGMKATGYHVVNILLHAISAVLVWRILKRLNIPGAWLAGLVFGIHPVNVESVAWITERKNTLPMVFYLTTILLYLHFESTRRKSLYVLALVTFLLALLSKTSVVMLPFVLIIIAWWQRERIDRKDIIRAIPFLCLAIALGLLTWWFQYNRAIKGEIIRVDGFTGRSACAGWAVWFYLAKVLVPYKLTFVYPRWQIDTTSVISYLPLAALLGCFILFWRCRDSWGRPLLAGLGYYVITLLPVLGFLDIYFMYYSLVADHWQYTSIIGAIALIVGLAGTFVNHGPLALRTPANILAVAVVSGLSVLTWRQTSIYTNPETLWRDTLQKNPNAWMAHNNLGTVLQDQNKLDEAIKHYSIAIGLKPEVALYHYNRGNAHNAKGEYALAIQNYNQAIKLKPDYADAYNNRGAAYGRLHDFDRELQDCTKAIDLKPNLADAYINRGNAYNEKGEYDLAILEYTKAIMLNPNDAATYTNRSVAYARKQDHEHVIQDCSKAIELDAGNAQAYQSRMIAFFFMRQYDKAWADVEKYRQLGQIPSPALIAELTKASGRSE